MKKAIDEHAEYSTTKLDRSRLVKKGAATRRCLGKQVAVNTHTMGTSFVGKVRDMRQIAEAQIGEGVADMVKFKAQVNGHEVTEKANRIQAWQGLQTGSSPTDLTRINLSYSYQVLGGVGSTSQSSRVQDGGKSRHAEPSANNVRSVGSSRSLVRTCTRRNWVEVAGAERGGNRTINLKP